VVNDKEEDGVVRNAKDMTTAVSRNHNVYRLDGITEKHMQIVEDSCSGELKQGAQDEP
jgi:hypothetical protein